MTRLFLPLVLGAAMLALGCGKSAVEAPMVPERTADHEIRTPSRRQDHPTPPLIAPPPAYGNKVVMAKAAVPPAIN